MGRRERRKRGRKARRQEIKTQDQHAHENGLLLPSLFPNGPTQETRDLRLRWNNLTARGGMKLGFQPTGGTVTVDYDTPAQAETALLVSTAHLVQSDEGDA
jgi:hypothetical protein